MSERKPLTPEELRGMANKPYWHVGLRDDSGAPHWSILDPILAYHPEDYDYGETWLAYAYEPPRLDRSAWEPCEHCKPSKNPLDRWGPHQFLIDGNEIYFYDTDDGWEGEEINFCPWCGRPLTDAAWDMLEKRLEKIT